MSTEHGASRPIRAATERWKSRAVLGRSWASTTTMPAPISLAMRASSSAGSPTGVWMTTAAFERSTMRLQSASSSKRAAATWPADSGESDGGERVIGSFRRVCSDSLVDDVHDVELDPRAVSDEAAHRLEQVLAHVGEIDAHQEDGAGRAVDGAVSMSSDGLRRPRSTAMPGHRDTGLRCVPNVAARTSGTLRARARRRVRRHLKPALRERSRRREPTMATNLEQTGQEDARRRGRRRRRHANRGRLRAAVGGARDPRSARRRGAHDLLWRAFCEPNDRPDVLVADVRMPKLSGLGVMHALRRAQWSLPVVVMTGMSDASVETVARRLGAAAFLTKPFTTEELLRAMQKANDAATVHGMRLHGGVGRGA